MKTAWMTTDAYSIGIGEDVFLAVRCDFPTSERHDLVAGVVRAVNNHDKLVEALRAVVNEISYDDATDEEQRVLRAAADLLASLDSMP